jgi:hypothetical protein
MACDPFLQNHKRVAADRLMGIYDDLDGNNLFMSIGRVAEWPDEQSPPVNQDSVQSETDFWRRVLAHKRIDRQDVSLVVRRYDWESGQVYAAYRDNVDLYDDLNPSRFYVLVDQERVYKCIDNNGGAASTVPPTHTDAEIRRLSDGYRWKFLYQISESKRKFLTKTQGDAIGYMPVEYVPYLNQNDERFLQWNIQNAAVNGEIGFVYLNPEVAPFVYTEKCLLPSNGNDVVGSFAVGATFVNITSSLMIPADDYYNNMVLSIDSGPGQGQRRRISSYKGLTTYSQVILDQPLSAALVSGATGSKFSIVPNIRVVGDGTAYNKQYNPYATSAEVLVRIGGTSGVPETDGSCLDINEARVVDSIELVDGGKDYTFASLQVVAGLTMPSRKAFLGIDNFGIPVMSPKGGHGSDAVKELGASSLMIVKDFDRTEDGTISTSNEFRQVAIILNPLLEEKQVRLNFRTNGLPASFVVGATATQTGMTATGEVVSWYVGATGFTGTSELVLTNIRVGDFAYGATVGNFTVSRVDERTVAGTEVRRLVRMELVPIDEFGVSNDDFKRGLLVQGMGDIADGLLPSRTIGEIYSWEPEPATSRLGFLYVENTSGEFKVGEAVTQVNPVTNTMVNGITGIAKIASLTTVVRGKKSYDQTSEVVLSAAVGANNFAADDFTEDGYLKFVSGLTESNGYVVEWVPTGTTGYMRLSGTNGRFVSGMSVASPSGITASITSVLGQSEMQYGSGDILYIQNVRPIARNYDQREEFKIVIDF